MSEFFALFVIIIVILFAGAIIEQTSCGNRGKRVGFESSYGVMQGCMIKTKTGWVDIDHYRVLQ